ncbi:MAG: OmpA family protein, partial [Bradyrhizobium sp.]|uniref:OmpA family protein n=1 Tax=Bradyrhizobium sp. TaxID=376 RepID=UPI0025C45F58
APPPPPAATRPAPPPPPPPSTRQAPPPPPPPPPAATPKAPPPPAAAPQTQERTPPPPRAATPPPPPPPPAATTPGRVAPSPTPTRPPPPPAAAPQPQALPTPAAPPPPAAGPATRVPPTPAPTPTPPPPPGRAGPAPAPAPTAAPSPTPGAPPPAGGSMAPPPDRQGATSPPPSPANGGAPSRVPAAGPAGAPPAGAPVTRPPAPTVAAPLPPPPPAPTQALTPVPQGAAPQGPTRMDAFRNERREVVQDGRTIITEPGRVIIRDPSGMGIVRHNELERFRYGARDIRTQRVGGETRTVVIRPDGSEIITVVGQDGQLMRRIRRDPMGREIIIIDNSYRDPRAVGGYYVDLPPPMVRIPANRYIVESDEASPELIYETMQAPPVDRVERRYSLDEIRYSPNVRMLMPSIDLNTINFDLGSWEITPDQAEKLQVIADGLNRAIQRNPREVFLIEGHTDATGNDTDNLSLSDRRAESAATLLTQQFGVPAENLTSQGYGSQYLKEQTSGPSRFNRRVTVRRITPLLNGGQASLPPPPPGIAPPR